MLGGGGIAVACSRAKERMRDVIFELVNINAKAICTYTVILCASATWPFALGEKGSCAQSMFMDRAVVVPKRYSRQSCRRGRFRPWSGSHLDWDTSKHEFAQLPQLS